MNSGVDFVLLGRAAIVHHDFPNQTAKDSHFTPVANPVSVEHLRTEGLSDTFIEYMSSWKGFVAETEGVITPEMILS